MFQANSISPPVRSLPFSSASLPTSLLAPLSVSQILQASPSAQGPSWPLKTRQDTSAFKIFPTVYTGHIQWYPCLWCWRLNTGRCTFCVQLAMCMFYAALCMFYTVMGCISAAICSPSTSINRLSETIKSRTVSVGLGILLIKVNRRGHRVSL